MPVRYIPNDRLLDLVVVSRVKLHEMGLLSDDEFALLDSEHGSVRRIADYQELRRHLELVGRQLAVLRTAVRQKVSVR